MSRQDLRYRDLSHPIETGMSIYPGDPAVDVSPATTVAEEGVSVQALRCGSHTGTHIDAPSHTEPGGEDIDDWAVEEYVFSARLVDVAPCEPREAIGIDHVPDALDGADLLVVRTGWDAHWNTATYLDHPYLTPDAARRLQEAGCGLALDALNPDPTPTDNASGDEPAGVPVHHTLLGGDRSILENLTGLDGLPDRFRLYAFPIPIANGDGAPVRAVAEVEP